MEPDIEYDISDALSLLPPDDIKALYTKIFKTAPPEDMEDDEIFENVENYLLQIPGLRTKVFEENVKELVNGHYTDMIDTRVQIYQGNTLIFDSGDKIRKWEGTVGSRGTVSETHPLPYVKYTIQRHPFT